ncbi:putative LRR receptor-like serine/threonine-protein kinase [Prunus yedoensis var. nudiflora]|uniref:Putative LRR receptor-like serine/threonine-protein kinase n=1 Tax=Prunus yedoensis var. nudiflora TaxID=2094558 RepID=A0A314Y156_PRUYE|nr:putative LRR receptor-like serine/threonine-protein kinase [Prunus yedoensis var. nudiflora]
MGASGSLFMLKMNNNNFEGEIPFSLQTCTSLRNIDFGDNRFTGKIPPWIGSIAFLVSTLRLRSNFFVGHIPQQLCNLAYLHILDLAHNSFSGTIPNCLNNLTGLIILDYKIGNLSQLQTLDLSLNHLSGRIPQGLSSLTFLSNLNLSYNNFRGEIPLGNQLRALPDPSIYEGNPLLCGFPVSTNCSNDTSNPKDPNDNGDGNDKLWFCVSMALGFIVGFWGVCSTLIVKKSWRYAYFRWFDDIKDKAALAIAVKAATFQRKL